MPTPIALQRMARPTVRRHVRRSVTRLSVLMAAQNFTQAIRIAITKSHPNPWNAQLRAPTTVAVKKGHVLLRTFSLRAVDTRAESGEVHANAIFERSAPPNNKALQIRCGVLFRVQVTREKMKRF